MGGPPWDMLPSGNYVWNAERRTLMSVTTNADTTCTVSIGYASEDRVDLRQQHEALIECQRTLTKLSGQLDEVKYQVGCAATEQERRGEIPVKGGGPSGLPGGETTAAVPPPASPSDHFRDATKKVGDGQPDENTAELDAVALALTQIALLCRGSGKKDVAIYQLAEAALGNLGKARARPMRESVEPDYTANRLATEAAVLVTVVEDWKSTGRVQYGEIIDRLLENVKSLSKKLEEQGRRGRDD